ncbi:MAG: hypothetical protein RLZZ21_1261 [Planctomycetota bacterium]
MKVWGATKTGAGEASRLDVVKAAKALSRLDLTITSIASFTSLETAA